MSELSNKQTENSVPSINDNQPNPQTEATQKQGNCSLFNVPPSPRTLTQIIYFCGALAFLFGISAIFGICINYLKRDAVKGTIYESHFIWQIRTFWIGLIIITFSWIIPFIQFSMVFFVPFIIGATIIWNIYRTVKGYLLLLDNKPIPEPNALP